MTGADEEAHLVGFTLYQRTRWTCPRCREAVVTLVRQKEEDSPPSEDSGESLGQ